MLLLFQLPVDTLSFPTLYPARSRSGSLRSGDSRAHLNLQIFKSKARQIVLLFTRDLFLSGLFPLNGSILTFVTGILRRHRLCCHLCSPRSNGRILAMTPLQGCYRCTSPSLRFLFLLLFGSPRISLHFYCLIHHNNLFLALLCNFPGLCISRGILQQMIGVKR